MAIQDFLKDKEVVHTKSNNYYFRKEFGQNIESKKEIINERGQSNLLDNHFGITDRNKDGKDNRLIVSQRDPFYNPLAEINIIYKFPKVEEDITFIGTGYRNSYHQLMTAGHNLFLTKKDILEVYKSLNALDNTRLNQAQKEIKRYLESERDLFSFDPARISFKVSFGKIENIVLPKYQHIFSHKDTVSLNDPYDFGLIHLHKNTLDDFDKEIGSYPLAKLPLDQPKDNVLYATIIGYPAEKKGLLVYDSGKIIGWDFVERRVNYLADTTGGQSGSPGFKGDLKHFILDNKINQIDLDDYPVSSTHISGWTGNYNVGQIHDDDIFEFLEKNKRI